jgi:structural maintenance of chromosome 2
MLVFRLFRTDSSVLLQVINEEISPKLQKLHDERSQYLEYQKLQRELEHLTRFYIAWQFYSAQVSID